MNHPWRYLDKISVVMFILTIGAAIGGHTFFMYLLALYVLASTIRLANLWEIIDLWLEDMDMRQTLGLQPHYTDRPKPKHLIDQLFAWVFMACAIAASVYLAMTPPWP
jgi:hypothetical protein